MSGAVSLPQKRFYRQRAHSNPIADHCFDYPAHPADYDWSVLYPDINGTVDQVVAAEAEAATATATKPQQQQQVEFADIGCGYGGFLVTLGELFPDRLAIGMEIRVKVSDYVMDRIQALRLLHPGQYRNIACLRTNAMKYLPNYFGKHQLSKLFFLYPDPHFKRSKHKWRIISQPLLTEYAYVLRPGGMIYTITDVRDLHEWMVGHLDEHELYERVGEEELATDCIVERLYESSEEGLKVTRNKGDKFVAIYRRRQH